MSLSVAIRHELGRFTLDVSFASEAPLVALFGASGSGKTSVVNAVAGLLRPTEGRIEVNGRVLVDSAAGLFVPAHRRRIGYVFQDARLFPHLTVRQNLRYGRFFAARKDHGTGFADIVDLLGIGHLLDRRPAGLSGGEVSRVAIGRALLAGPELILMDEPLASLDEARKAEILPFIERLRDEIGLSILYVSHAAAEVARLASDIVVLAGGRVAASGPADAIMERLDLLGDSERGEGSATIELEAVGKDAGYGLSVLRSAGGEWLLPGLEAAVGTRLRVRIRARDVMLATSRPEGLSANNVLAGTVLTIEPAGVEALVRLDCGGDVLVARVTRFSVERLGLRPGACVFAVVKAVSLGKGATMPAGSPRPEGRKT